MDENYQTAYQKLNAAQKKAVDTIDGPVLVTAGPGTGKTQVLTLRIANILQQTDTNPENILALTFTDAAAANMRDRLASHIGSSAYRVRIQTFHAFCQDLIDTHPHYFHFDSSARPLTDVERLDIVRTLLESFPFQHIRTPGSPHHWISPLIQAISIIKREGLSVQAFADAVQQEEKSLEEIRDTLKKTALAKATDSLARQKEIAIFYDQYSKALEKRHRFDFEDMIIDTIGALQAHPTFLQQVQEQIHYMLIDEYQDTNGAQNTLAFLLAHYWGEAANIFVVGDPNQTIYRFQGATLENVVQFHARFPNATHIIFETGYRCPQSVYTAAAACLTSEETPLQSATVSSERVCITQTKDETAQYVALAKEIMLQHSSGTPYGEIALLIKKHSQSAPLAKVLAQFCIPYSVIGKSNILESTWIQRILSLLKLIDTLSQKKEAIHIFHVLSQDWMQVDYTLLMQLSRQAGEKGSLGIYDIVRSHEKTTMDSKMMRIAAILDTFDELSIKKETERLDAFLQHVLDKFSIIPWCMTNENAEQSIAELSTLLAYAQQLQQESDQYSLGDFLAHLEIMQAESLPLPLRNQKSDRTNVSILTVHGAKGMEWDMVCIPNCIDGVWGNARPPFSFTLPSTMLLHTQEHHTDDDDRRLFYVALTRAKKRLHLFYPTVSNDSQKEKALVRSQYLYDIPSSCYTFVDTSSQQLTLKDQVQLLQPVVWKTDQREWVKKIVHNIPLSATLLNEYLRSPKLFFSRHVIRLPSAPTGAVLYGTAVHKALEFHYRHYTKTKSHPSHDQTIDIFTHTLHKEFLLPADFSRWHTEGTKTITSYLQKATQELPRVMAVEEVFGKQTPLSIHSVPLKGKIDRIDFDAAEHSVVIDYKTGSQKTTNEIEGLVNTKDYSERELSLPESIRGPFKRQLLFYKLLLDLDPRYSQHKNTTGVFDFVTPKDGKHVRRVFTLDDADVDSLITLIQQVYSEIQNLQFLDNLELKSVQ